MVSNSLVAAVLPHALRTDRIAVEVPETGVTLSYGALVDRIDALGRDLADAGIAGARVALVLPNELDALVTALAIAGQATCIPLNPAYTEAELRRYLAATRAAALVAAHATPAALAAAASLGLTVIGAEGAIRPLPSTVERSHRGFLFQTSGTTATPRGVPLTIANIAAGVRNVIEAVDLTELDASWLVMPLFHVHGLIGAALATLGSGGRLLLPSAFHAPALLDALDAGRPTWFTASPARHHALVAYAESTSRPMKGYLRFARSASAPMTTQLREQLHEFLGAPIVHAYGMTEAAHQIASSSLRSPVPAHVGRPIGCEVRILAEDGTFALQGELGEILIRGDAIARAYDPPVSGVDSDGWLHTGDLGLFSGKGNLHLVARTKEVINRGGEKIAPTEIDDVLSTHPAVLEAAAFGMPSRRLGEAVAAAVVLRPGTYALADELQAFVAERLAAFKVPGEIYVVDALPRGATGKIQRTALTANFEGARDAPQPSSAHPPQQPTPLSAEEIVMAIWRDALQVEEFGEMDDFFELGGDSLSAQDVVLQVSGRFGIEPSMSEFFAEPTVRGMASRIRARRPAGRAAHSPVIALRAGTEPGALIVVQGAGFSVDQYRGLIRWLSTGMPVIGLQEDVFRGEPDEHGSLVDLAQRFASAVREASAGPYYLTGYSSAGVIALEVARALGDDAARLILVDAIPGKLRGAGTWARFGLRVLLTHAVSELPYYMHWTARGARNRLARLGTLLRVSADRSQNEETIEASQQLGRLVRHYHPSHVDLPVTLLATPESQRRANDPRLGWGGATEDLEVLVIEGQHGSLLRQPSVVAVAEMIDGVLAQHRV